MFRKNDTLLAFLLLSLAAPDFSVTLAEARRSLPNEAVENAVDPPTDDSDTSDDNEDQQKEDPYPRGRLAPQPGAVEQVQRALRVPGLCKLTPRSLEKGLARSQCPISLAARVEQVVAQERCVTTSLSVVASTVRCHAPPLGSPIL